MLEATFAKDIKQFSPEKDGEQYVSVLAILSDIGSENKSVSIYQNSNPIGKVKCLSIAKTYGKDFKIWNYKWE